MENKLIRLEPVEANKKIYGKRPLDTVRVVKTIRDMFDSSCELFADNVAFLRRASQKSDWTEIKYKEAGRAVYALGTALIKLGLKDKKIAIIGENVIGWVIAYYAILCGGNITVPMDCKLPAEDLSDLVRIVSAEDILCDGPSVDHGAARCLIAECHDCAVGVGSDVNGVLRDIGSCYLGINIDAEVCCQLFLSN